MPYYSTSVRAFEQASGLTGLMRTKTSWGRTFKYMSEQAMEFVDNMVRDTRVLGFQDTLRMRDEHKAARVEQNTCGLPKLVGGSGSRKAKVFTNSLVTAEEVAHVHPEERFEFNGSYDDYKGEAIVVTDGIMAHSQACFLISRTHQTSSSGSSDPPPGTSS